LSFVLVWLGFALLGFWLGFCPGLAFGLVLAWLWLGLILG
jgi:hypothetical protein